jgi:hypothetical protein
MKIDIQANRLNCGVKAFNSPVLKGLPAAGSLGYSAASVASWASEALGKKNSLMYAMVSPGVLYIFSLIVPVREENLR